MWFVVYSLEWEGAIVNAYDNKDDAIKEYKKVVEEKERFGYFEIEVIEGKVILKDEDDK